MKRILAISCLLLAGLSQADERILAYHSDILVRADGRIEVTESITVRAEGRQIRRGIFRDYPVSYEDDAGNNVRVRYEPTALARNGSPEPFFSETHGDNVRTYFGSADRLIANGEHTYEYSYVAGRMLGFFEQYDELYWNVTGVESDFPIDNASAAVRFEFDVPGDALDLDAYTGTFGTLGTDFNTEVDGNGTAWFRTTRGLPPRAGLTIVVAWPKGFVAEPGPLQAVVWLLSDNLNLLIALAGLAAMLGYYVPVWKNYGKDPVPGVIVTRYEPPEGFSPASLRYIDNMGYDTEVMTAGVVSLAVKGYLRIHEDDDEHTLERVDPSGNTAPLAAGEAALYEALFDDGNVVKLVDDNHETIGGARKAHEASLKADYHKRYFRTNGLLNLPPLLIGVISAVIALVVGQSLLTFVTIALMIVTLLVFAVILKQPTGLGRAVMDESAGFREYLDIAEKDELNLRNPPEKTPDLFERYLPFALALGVEQQWAERFARIFATISGPNEAEWQPGWYSGSWNSRSLGSSMSHVSSGLSSSISSSVSPPGSSSGTGGGGFSGGGGGGGGVGGW